MIHDIMLVLVNGIGALGYPGIFILMAMECSLVPFPSELVLPPAGYLAQQGLLNPWIVIFVGTTGSLVGAYANYYVADHETPKGYLYFAMAFSFAVEMLNLRLRKKSPSVQLHQIYDEIAKDTKKNVDGESAV